MHRLYSTFASGLPGIGLLIMRLVAGAVLVFRGSQGLLGELSIGPPAIHIVRILLSPMLVAGLWTPVTGVAIAILEIGMLVARAGDPWVHVLLMTLGIALSLLGPGAWSVDAWLFGWRRIDIRERPGRS